MDIGEVLTRAWNIVWKLRVLWIFGILSSCVYNGANPRPEYQLGSRDVPWFRGMPSFRFENYPGLVIAAVVLVILLAILFLVLGTYGRIGVARGTWLADEGAERLTFRELWNQSSHYFWRVIGLLLLIFALGIMAFILLTVPFVGGYFISASGGGPLPNWATLWPLAPLALCLVCLLVPLSWAIGLLVEQAIVAIVGDDVSVTEALSRAWNAIKTSPGMVIVLALILYVGRGIISFILALPFLAAVVPVIVALAFQTTNALRVGVSIGMLVALILLPIYLLVNGIIQAYVGSSWALAYRRLTGRQAGSITPPPVDVPSS